MARKSEPKPAARKASASKGRGRRAAETPEAATPAESISERRPGSSARDRVIDALMELAAERPWDDIEIRDIADAAGVSLSEFRDLFPSKGAILAAFSKRIDKIVLEGTTDDLEGEPVRERLFDVFMRRLDALTPYKEALKRIVRAVRTDPLTMAALNQMQLNSQRFMLAAAGIDTDGPVGMVKLQGAVLIYARMLDTWFEDDDPGLARTMATLDSDLRRGGQFITGLNDICRMAAPFAALFRRVAEDGRRMRERRRARRMDDRDAEDDGDYARA